VKPGGGGKSPKDSTATKRDRDGDRE